MTSWGREENGGKRHNIAVRSMPAAGLERTQKKKTMAEKIPPDGATMMKENEDCASRQ